MLYDYRYMLLGNYLNDNSSNNKSHIITFQKNYEVTLQFTEGQVLGINDWIIEKCNSTKRVEYQKQNLPKNIINMAELESKTRVITSDPVHGTTFLEVKPEKNVNLYLEFQEGDMMYFNHWLSKALFEPLSVSGDLLSSTKLIELVEQGVITYNTVEYPEYAKVIMKSKLGQSR